MQNYLRGLDVDVTTMRLVMMKPCSPRRINKDLTTGHQQLNMWLKMHLIFFPTHCVFQTTINLTVLAACPLYNYLLDSSTFYAPLAFTDEEDDQHNLSLGAWGSGREMTPLIAAKNQRELLTCLFNNSGAVPWQEKYFG